MHNGIVENHNALRDRFKAHGHVFKSETDSEVLAHLVESNYQGDLLEAVKVSLKEVEGTYGITCMVKDEREYWLLPASGSPSSLDWVKMKPSSHQTLQLLLPTPAKHLSGRQ